MSINIETFNKLINSNKDMFQKTYEINNNNIVKNYKNLKKNNIYIKKINKLWKQMNKSNKIRLLSDKISFIESDFEGTYTEYLIFIIPRITKLNEKMLEVLISDTENIDSKVDFLDSFDVSTESSNNDDIDYIQLLELNINELQSKTQNISDILLPKLNKFEEIIKKSESDISNSLQNFDTIIKDNKLTLDNKLEEFNTTIEKNESTINNSSEQFKENINITVNDSLQKIESFMETKKNIDITLENFQERMIALENKIEDHQKYTKNSILILESRISKIIELVTKNRE